MGVIYVKDEILVSLKTKYGDNYSKVVNKVLKELLNSDEEFAAREALKRFNKALDEVRKYYNVEITKLERKKREEKQEVELTERELKILKASGGEINAEKGM